MVERGNRYEDGNVPINESSIWMGIWVEVSATTTSACCERSGEIESAEIELWHF
jgi:hypothetical protein